MNSDVLYNIGIASCALLLVMHGGFVFIKKGGSLRTKELRQAAVILAFGEVVCGLMYLGYLVYDIWFKLPRR